MSDCECGCAGSCGCSPENPANLAMLRPGVGGEPRVAEVEICDEKVCEIGHFLVRGDHVSFVSVEQVRRVGEHKLDPHRMPSDIRLPRGYVVVNDPTGRLLSKCDVYVLPWRRKRSFSRQQVHARDLAAAREYFGTDDLRNGEIVIPEKKWTRVARVAFIRYRRYGFTKPFEHRYDPPVDLFQHARPLGWRLPLPEGCLIDSRGFVRP